MGNDAKAEPASPSVGFCEGLSDEVKAEVASLVQAALAKMQNQQPIYECSVSKTLLAVAEISTRDAESETERKYKEIASILEAKLSETNKQLENTHRDLDDVRDQLEKQRAKSVLFEQRILQMSEAEGTLKSTLAVLRAEKDNALAREREAQLSRDRAMIHNVQLLNQLTELQSNLDLKTAELNDAAYIRQQLDSRISELNKENMSLRQVTPSQGPPTGAQPQSGVAAGPTTSPQSTQPPSSLCFPAPVIGTTRRNTVPNICAPPAAPATPNRLPFNRPPKRARADSGGSDGSEVTRSRVSSGSSMPFTLRPVKPEAAESNQSTPTPTVPSNSARRAPQYQAYSLISPTAPASPYYAQQRQSTYVAPIPYQNQGPYQTQIMVPSSAPPTIATAPPVTRPHASTIVSNPIQITQPAPVQWDPIQQFINEMYLYTASGFSECKICKVRPLGRPNANGISTPPTVPDLLAHAEKYHGRTVIRKPTQQQLT
ncbi:hypothetical protein OPQ81_009414 [Rhizoctonia solani]|nr:hypothetical protein OPQ81_009414 [Rhizoctonia solani]